VEVELNSLVEELQGLFLNLALISSLWKRHGEGSWSSQWINLVG
jgi:hypothetical protein